jgi:hypothetical protein
MPGQFVCEFPDMPVHYCFGVDVVVCPRGAMPKPRAFQAGRLGRIVKGNGDASASGIGWRETPERIGRRIDAFGFKTGSKLKGNVVGGS